MHTLSMLRPMERRIFYLLLISGFVLAATLVGRLRAGPGAVVVPAERTARTAAPLSTAEVVTRMRAAVEADPDSADAYAGLGLALLQAVRETADPALYGQAETALDEALRRDPDQLDALVGQGLLALARHDFRAALEWGRQAQELMPYRADALGILVDAHVELGQYDAAVEAAQAMANLRPNLASYSRVSYVRELRGDTDGAIAAMEAAVAAGAPGAESTAWTQTQLGHLHFRRGDLAAAEATWRETLAQQPDYPYAQAGLARVLAARGDRPQAIEMLEGIAARLPLPEFLLTLGQLYEADGQLPQAERQYDLIRVIQQLNADSGMNVDLELALFEADHGDPATALDMARRAYEARPSIHAADALAWASWRAGDADAAQTHITEALRLNTQDALLFYHAGMIAAARGDRAAATVHLGRALELNPWFDFAQTIIARDTLSALSAGQENQP